MPLNNQIVPERHDWSCMVFNGLPPGSGILFEEATLDERIGAEAVALLIHLGLSQDRNIGVGVFQCTVRRAASFRPQYESAAPTQYRGSALSSRTRGRRSRKAFV